MQKSNPFEQNLDRNAANHAPLTPLSFLERSAYVYPERVSVIHGTRRFTWRETYARSRRLASALAKRGIGKGDTVAAINKFGIAERIGYISTAGGAFLEFLEGKTLPGVEALT